MTTDNLAERQRLYLELRKWVEDLPNRPLLPGTPEKTQEQIDDETEEFIAMSRQVFGESQLSEGTQKRLADMRKMIDDALTRNRWDVEYEHTYDGAVLRYYLDHDVLIEDYPFDYLHGMIVLTARCAACRSAMAQLCVSPNLPHKNHVELARYAYWVPLAYQKDARSRCVHKGSLPDPSTLVPDVSRSLGEARRRNDLYFEDGAKFEAYGSVVVRPTSA